MNTKFYQGNYTLTIGQPFVIISAEEKANVFYAEKIIIFESFDGATLIGDRVKYPKISNRTIEDFISSEIQACKNDIFYKILLKKYNTQLEKRNYNVSVELVEVNSNLISLLRDKFPKILDNIRKGTSNAELRSLIELYQSIVVERNDIDF